MNLKVLSFMILSLSIVSCSTSKEKREVASVFSKHTFEVSGSMADYRSFESLKLNKKSTSDLADGVEIFITKVGSLGNTEVSSKSVRTGLPVCSSKRMQKDSVQADGTLKKIDVMRVLTQAPVCSMKKYKSGAKIKGYYLVEKKKLIGRGTKMVKEKITINFALDEEPKVVTKFEVEQLSVEDRAYEAYGFYCQGSSKSANTSEFSYSSEDKEILRECFGL